MLISQIKKRDLPKVRRIIEKRLTHLRPTRISNLTDTKMEIEGGIFPARFTKAGGLYVWSRGARHSGGEMNVIDLVETENQIRQFYKELKLANELDELL